MEPKGVSKKITFKDRQNSKETKIWSAPMQFEFATRGLKQKAEDFLRRLLPSLSITPCFCGRSMILKRKLVEKAKTDYSGKQFIVQPFNEYLAVISLKNDENKWKPVHFRDPYDNIGFETLDLYLKSKNLNKFFKPIKNPESLDADLPDIQNNEEPLQTEKNFENTEPMDEQNG